MLGNYKAMIAYYTPRPQANGTTHIAIPRSLSSTSQRLARVMRIVGIPSSFSWGIPVAVRGTYAQGVTATVRSLDPVVPPDSLIVTNAS